ncbi:MAG: hypothetical protein HC932_00390 [Thermales bacterium]|nr:hypothetical protein [Thermales bacterium]
MLKVYLVESTVDRKKYFYIKLFGIVLEKIWVSRAYFDDNSNQLRLRFLKVHMSVEDYCAFKDSYVESCRRDFENLLID